jgi:UDP-N-acetylmuramoyl-tripeptide--D-alanyl-D-alanine ligase
MRRLSFEEILVATGGRLLYGKPNGVEGISIDSRTIREGELFVAIKGARFDGHNFVSQALNRGCGAIVSVPPSTPPKGKVIIYVSNTLKAIQDIAHYLRMKNRIPVVGITGTNGKTTTKEMTASILGTRLRTLKNTGNLNNQIGLPLSLFDISDEDQAAVLEMGASSPGDIRELCGIAAPDYAVITNLGLAHIEGFEDLEAIRNTKLEILESVKAVVVNADDLFLMEGVEGFKGDIIRYGMETAADIYARDVECKERDCVFTLHYRGQRTRVKLQVTGRFNVYNALAAASVGAMFDIDLDRVKQGLESFEGVPMRLEIKEMGGATIISDVYNANPASMEEALKELVRLRNKRAVAVLGDMLELGSYSEAAHRRLGRWMASIPVDLFIAVGPYMAMAADEFTVLRGRALKAVNSEEARKILLNEYTKDDTVLIKGSRSMLMEKVINGEGMDSDRIPESSNPASNARDNAL